MAPDRPSGRFGRALSLVAENSASAKEEVLYTVIGEDAWIFAEKVVTECAKRFPTLAGTRTSTASTANHLRISSNSKGMPPSPRVSANLDVVEADEAAFSCKFWIDGMKELSGGDDHSEEDSDCYQSKGSDTTAPMTVEDITSSHDPPALLVAKDPVTPLFAEEKKLFLPVTPTSSPCRSVQTAPTSGWDSTASTSSAMKRHTIGMGPSIPLPGQERKRASFAAGVLAAGDKPSANKAPKAARNSTMSTSSQHSKGRMSVSSAISTLRSTLFSVVDDFGEESKRTVVSARYYPVEKFSEEVPICRTLKQFKDSIMLFVLDERNEEENSAEEKLKNLERRKGEVERWMKNAMQHHHLGGAPTMLCIFLVHDEYAPGGFHKMHTTMTQASLKVNVGPEAKSLPGRLSSNSASFTPLNSSGSKGAVKEVVPLTHAEKLRAFSEELRRLTKADEDDVLQYACNFDDPDAMLKFIVTMSNDIIERRKHDSIFLTKPDDFEDKKPSRCRCSCVVA